MTEMLVAGPVETIEWIVVVTDAMIVRWNRKTDIAAAIAIHVIGIIFVRDRNASSTMRA